MFNPVFIGLLALSGAILLTISGALIVSGNRARILRHEDAKASELTLAGAIDEDLDMPEPDEDSVDGMLAEAVGAARPFGDATETFQVADAHTLTAVAQNLVFVDIELGRAYSEIPDAADPWLSDAEVVESTEIALATIETLRNVEAHIPQRSGEPSGDVLGDSWATTQLRRIHAALTDSMVADALIAHDPMMAFLLPVKDDEPLPDFDDSLAAWLPEHRTDDGHDLDGNSISWHTGLTQAMRIVRQPALESAESVR